jgi:hypothetical protein
MNKYNAINLNFVYSTDKCEAHTKGECTALRSKRRKRTIRNDPSEEANTGAVDEVRDKTIGT